MTNQSAMPPIAQSDRALITEAGYNADDQRERELGLMALHCAGMFFETGTVKGTPPGRNEPCPCGSGKKYKKCCRADDEAKATTPARKMEVGHVPQIFNDDAVDADQDKLYNLLLEEPTLKHVRYDPEVLDAFLLAGMPENEAELDAEGWTDVMTDLAQKFHVQHGEEIDVVAALLHCGRTGDHDMLALRALANAILHLALADMSKQQEMNVVAAEILRATVNDAAAAGAPLKAFADMDID